MTDMTFPFENRRIRPAHPPATSPKAGCCPIPIHDAADLTHGGLVAHIRLDAQTYTLRITRQGKLILTK